MAEAGTTMENAKNTTFSTLMESNKLDFFETIVDRQWKVYSVSKLHNFEASAVKLKHHARIIGENIAGVMSTTDNSYDEVKAQITIENEFSETAFDEKAICITVTTVSLKKNKKKIKKDEKIIYSGYILSRGQLIHHEHLPQLPVLICGKYGTEKIITCVHETLQQLFDCVISKHLFDQRDLKWLFIISIDLEDEFTDKGSIELNFTVPQLASKNTFSIEIEAEVTRKIWLKKRQHSQFFTEKEVETLVANIMTHVSQVHGVHLNQMVLKSVNSTNSVCDSSGQFIPRSKESAAIVLKYLTNSIQQRAAFNLPALLF